MQALSIRASAQQPVSVFVYHDHMLDKNVKYLTERLEGIKAQCAKHTRIYSDDALFLVLSIEQLLNEREQALSHLKGRRFDAPVVEPVIRILES